MKRLPLPLEKLESKTSLSIKRRQVESFIMLQRLHSAVELRTKTHFKLEGISDITPSQANVLMVLFQRRRPLTAREIHTELGVSEVTVSRLVNALVNKDWVVRRSHPDDGRAVLLAPTNKARAHLGAFIKVANALIEETFNGLEDDDLEALYQGVLTIHDNLNKSEN